MDRGKTLIGVLGGLVSGLAVMAGLLAVVRAISITPAPAPKPTGKIRVMVRSAMGSGQLLIDGELCGSGKCELDLKPGLHVAEARRAGYEGESREFTAKAGLEIELALKPLPSVVEVVSDLMSGELRLDNQPAVALGGGGAQLTGIDPGEHRLRFNSGAFRADFKFEVQPGAPPRLLVPPSASGLRAIVVAGAGPNGRLWATDKNAELAIGARELGLIPEEGLALPAMERGAHRFVLKPAKGQEIGFAYEIAANPTAWIWLRTNRRLGTLRILTADADDAKVMLDGKDTGARIRNGRSMMLAPPGNHLVGVEKVGFAAPGERQVAVLEGGETEIEFKLVPLPTRALLPIAGAPPGAVFAIDDKPVGTAALDGSLLVGDLDPGQHLVTARREGFLPGRWETKLTVGRGAVLYALMMRAPATLRIELSASGAADAKLTIRRLGQFEERAVTGSILQLPEGEYTVTASDAKEQRVSTHVRLEAGKETTVSLSLGARLLVQETAEPAKPAKHLSLSDWDGAPGWTRQGDRLVNEGNGIMLAPVRASGQTVIFNVHARPGKSVRWVTQFRDANNYTLYELGGGGLSRSDLVRGKRILRNRAPLNGAATESVRVRMIQQAGALRTSVFAGGQWVDLDTADTTNGTGRFGFYLVERDWLAVSEFRYEY